MQYLTVEQALADFAVLITDIKKKNPLLSNSPVITIGGSYGGMLSTWFRIKYPHIVEAAFASSAPIVQIHGIKSDYSFYKIVTDDYTAYVDLFFWRCSRSVVADLVTI
jgi:lysosomal Pro-X carboxypeptidase